METFSYHTTARFWQRVATTNPADCWEWLGSRRGDSYGQVYANGRHIAAHRLAHYLTTLTWPEVVRHKCDNRVCCNPHHLEGGTQTDNMRDVVQRGRHYHANKTRCPHGHDYTQDNTYIRPNGSRECRTCRRQRKRDTRNMALPPMQGPCHNLCAGVPNTDTPLP